MFVEGFTEILFFICFLVNRTLNLSFDHHFFSRILEFSILMIVGELWEIKNIEKNRIIVLKIKKPSYLCVEFMVL